ncbi:MAG: malate synthase G [Thermoleophilia bacterium]|nr:malate synthase G [Thermoleophilia bacterium]
MIAVADLSIAKPLHAFLTEEALSGSGVDTDRFFIGLSEMIHRFGPRNIELLQTRDRMQRAIDEWNVAHRDGPRDVAGYRAFLEDLGYIVPAGPKFSLTTENVDAEIASVAGPQLVVPVSNGRYALNAANARWGSLYNAVYGTDVLGARPKPGPYDPARGAVVVDWARRHLDEVVPLATGSHVGSRRYAIEDGWLVVTLADGATTRLLDPSQLRAYDGDPASPSAILLQRHGLGIDLRCEGGPIGAADTAGLSDIVIESAVTTIVDFEDSVAAVDADDKTACYRNWLGLMRGTLTEQVAKEGRVFTRALEKDRQYVGVDGAPVRVPGRSLMLVRNVGLLMTTPAVRDRDGREVPEGLLDAMITVLAAMHDLRREPDQRNSQCGSIYVVKPKLHGADEAAFTHDVFTFVESVLGLQPNTVKVGIMDEERRTSVNLAECIRAVQSRIVFINTGFLDRTGDEIHTSMHAGPMVRKGEMKNEPWLRTYETRNVQVGLACGFHGRAQIGKGMWPAPDLMADMLRDKIAHPRSGASCAWVPSPVAATLHALHYHQIDALSVQAGLAAASTMALDDLLTIPIASSPHWSRDEIRAEVDNNVQGILGYVVRWVDAGIGCSKVPNIDNIALMEDRATCRISSQHVANWLHNDIVDEELVESALRRLAVQVDLQNSDNTAYVPMAPSFDGHAFRAARELIFAGVAQPSGYTEPTLHAHRSAAQR